MSIANRIRLLLVACCAGFAGVAGADETRVAAPDALMSWPIPSPDSEPIEITMGADGNMWFVLQNASSVARLEADGTITQFPLRTFGFPNDIALGPDGNVWFTGGNGTIARITPEGIIHQFRYDIADSALGITKGPGATMWFTDVGDQVWRYDIVGRTFTPFQLPAGTFPGDIALGADGNLWFTQGSGLGRLTPEGVYTPFAVGEATAYAITRGPDGNIWFTERFGQRIGKVTPAGDITYYTTTLHTLDSIVRGPGNTLWFTSFGDDRIARITTDGVITPSPEIPGSGPTGIFVNRVGIWFLGYSSNRVYRITP
jgi:streptogramin lyase